MNTVKTLTRLSCFIAITLAFVQVCYAQNWPQDYVDAHNAARAAVGVENIEWDDGVAAYAEQYANERIGDCELLHSQSEYGENLAKGGGDFTGTDAVQMWVDEQANYDYDSNTCADGEPCGHYTQVVWRNSVSVGCARIQCNDGWFFITCNYSPPGNYVGQKPY